MSAFHRPTGFKSNVIANFIGQTITAILGIVFLPLYVRFLGIEAYGLIGFFVSLQAFFVILDMGLSSTLNRELARLTHDPDPFGHRRNLVRTLERLYWPIGGIIALLVLLASHPIAVHWLKPVDYGVGRTAAAIAMMGVATALQWPSALYTGGLRGVGRQVVLNAINVASALLRSLGALAVLEYISPTLEAFLAWQIAVGLMQSLMLRSALWQALPRQPGVPEAAFSMDILRGVRSFTLGMTGIAALSFLLMQSDRLILSALLPLNAFGYYSVAATVAGGLSPLVGPFFNALFPRYTSLVGLGMTRELVDVYHLSNQLLVATVAPTAAVLSLFSFDVLLLWSRDPTLAQNGSMILSILVVGTALNGIMHLPYALQLSHGWTRLSIVQNIIAVAILLPTTWWAAHRYGAVGAACIWVVLNLGYVVFSIPVMHRRLLVGEMRAWYTQDLLPPVLASVIVAGLARRFIEVPKGVLAGIATIGLVGICTLAAAVLSAPLARRQVLDLLRAFPRRARDASSRP
jgi:O-antigen/teichoic acid export membrane protein